MNIYLEKVAQMMSDENSQVAKTFAAQTAVSIPTHIAGLAAGGALGAKYLNGVAGKIGSGMAHVGSKIQGAGRAGAWAAGKLAKGKGITGMALGGIIGMQAAGGLGDLAALKAGFHEHGKQK